MPSTGSTGNGQQSTRGDTMKGRLAINTTIVIIQEVRDKGESVNREEQRGIILKRRQVKLENPTCATCQRLLQYHGSLEVPRAIFRPTKMKPKPIRIAPSDVAMQSHLKSGSFTAKLMGNRLHTKMPIPAT